MLLLSAVGHMVPSFEQESLFYISFYLLCFPCSSVGKESACNAEDLGSIPGSGRSPGEGIGYPLQYSWVSPVAQLVKVSMFFVF